MTSDVIRIFPKVSELNTIVNKIECPEENCKEVFHNTPNLSLHLLKTHGKDRSLKSSAYGCKVAQYYCPESGCKYCFNPDLQDENRFFTQFKYLKQHYIKVHLAKTFKCEKCNKAFATELHRSRHHEVCGNKYGCSCGVVYSSLESLQTHARREKHVYTKQNIEGIDKRMQKSNSETKQNRNVCTTHNSIIASYQNEDLKKTHYNLLRLPKDMNLFILHEVIKLDNNTVTKDESPSNVTVSTQTEISRHRRTSPVKGHEKPVKKRKSKQTQTGEKRPKKTTETQTVHPNLVSEEIKKGSLKNNKVINVRKRKKSMETQTAPSTASSSGNISINNNIIDCTDYSTNSSSKHISSDIVNDSNSSDNMNQKDICLPQLWLNNENDSDKVSKNENYSTGLGNSESENDNISSLCLVDNVERRLEFGHNFSFYNKEHDFTKPVNKETNSSCHIETQTDYDINNIFNDYLSNFDNDILDQYTQTCDDIMLPDDIALDLTNNETQTAWSLCNDSFISDVANSETQTNPWSDVNDHDK